MSAWPFYLAYLMPASVVAGYLLGGVFAFLTLFLAFVIIPFLDLIVAPDRSNPTPEETEALAHRLSFRLVTNLYAAGMDPRVYKVREQLAT